MTTTIGVDIGGSSTTAVAIGPDGQVVGRHQVKTGVEGGRQVVASARRRIRLVRGRRLRGDRNRRARSGRSDDRRGGHGRQPRRRRRVVPPGSRDRCGARLPGDRRERRPGCRPRGPREPAPRWPEPGEPRDGQHRNRNLCRRRSEGCIVTRSPRHGRRDRPCRRRRIGRHVPMRPAGLSRGGRGRARHIQGMAQRGERDCRHCPVRSGRGR